VLHTATRGCLGNSLVFRCQLDQHTLRTLVGRGAGACKRAADPAPDTALSGRFAAWRDAMGPVMGLFMDGTGSGHQYQSRLTDRCHRTVKGSGMKDEEANARATNAEPWEPLHGMVKRQCPECWYFFAAPHRARTGLLCPDCASAGTRTVLHHDGG